VGEVSGDVIAMIDGAIDDYTLNNGDAMRWTPDPPAEPVKADPPRRPALVAEPRPPRVTSVEMVVRTSDGKAQTYTFHGEEHHLQVDVETRSERDLWDPYAVRRLASWMSVSATIKVDSQGPGPMVTVTLPRDPQPNDARNDGAA
jgi:hypothetical protein